MSFGELAAYLLMAPMLFAQGPSSDLAEAWRASGKYFAWKSSNPEDQGRTVQVFYTCMGDVAKPSILMVHGFPTSSFDFRLLAKQLETDFHICTLDFPGYGVSDKPGAGYRYTLADDAQLLWHFVTEIAPMKEFILFSHDRGDSVALNFLQLYQAAANPPFHITYQFLTNGNMYLPLANLTAFQKRMLDPNTSAAAVKAVNAGILAAGMGSTNFTPPLKADDPEVRALAFHFAFQDGVRVIPATIQYLNERRKMENSFLETLRRSTIPTAILWGVHDMVSPVRVADYVWKTALESRQAPGSYWLMPCGNHYVQHDQPGAIARVFRLMVTKGVPAAPYNAAPDGCAPVLAAAVR